VCLNKVTIVAGVVWRGEARLQRTRQHSLCKSIFLEYIFWFHGWSHLKCLPPMKLFCFFRIVFAASHDLHQRIKFAFMSHDLPPWYIMFHMTETIWKRQKKTFLDR